MICRAWAGIALLILSSPSTAQTDYIVEKSLSDLSGAMANGAVSSETITAAYLERIAAIDDAGPKLNAVLVTNPEAIAIAKALDKQRSAGKVAGPLHGIPILIKDNIDTLDVMATTAGSTALVTNLSWRDAPVVARLRAAGAVILGKTNLSEWANFRSFNSVSGWSGVGGLVKNPYALNRNSCGSSSGSGAATAASLAAASVGTETDGSIICPAAANGLVGMKPTVGLVSRAYIIPISHSQDTAGPMARSVRDAAMLLTVMAGSDPVDPATKDADARKSNYTAGLSADGVKGVRIGVLRDRMVGRPETNAVFETALTTLKNAGAILVDIADSKSGMEGADDAEFAVLLSEFKVGLNSYLEGTSQDLPARNLTELIAYNKTHAATEMPWFGQELFELSDATKGLDDPEYIKARGTAQKLARGKIDQLLHDNKVTILVAPSMGAPWLSDPVNGDKFDSNGITQYPAMAGYPHLTVPMGQVHGLPVGLSFVGTAWSEAALFNAGYAFEQAAKGRKAPQYVSDVMK